MTGPDVRASMTAGCVELLRTGCTTSVEMYFFTDDVLDAVTAVGSRVVLTPGIIAAPGWDRLGSWEQMRDAVSARIDEVGLRSGPGERIELGYGPHAAYTLPAAGAGLDRRARPGARRAAAHPRGRERGGGRSRSAPPRLGARAAGRARRARRPGAGRARRAAVRRRHRPVRRPRDRGRALPRLQREARRRRRPGDGAAPGRRPGRPGHRRPGLGRRPRPVGRGPAGRPAGPGDQLGRGRDHRVGAAVDGHPGGCGGDRARRPGRPRARPLGRPGAPGPGRRRPSWPPTTTPS